MIKVSWDKANFADTQIKNNDISNKKVKVFCIEQQNNVYKMSVSSVFYQFCL